MAQDFQRIHAQGSARGDEAGCSGKGQEEGDGACVAGRVEMAQAEEHTAKGQGQACRQGNADSRHGYNSHVEMDGLAEVGAFPVDLDVYHWPATEIQHG